MKPFDYRSLIIVLMSIFIIPIGVMVLYSPQTIKNPALIINNKKISNTVLNDTMNKTKDSDNYHEIINNTVINELLIQEAVNSEINTEKHFRESMKHYYEKLLIKLVMEKKYAEFKPLIKTEWVDNYQKLSDKIVNINIINAESKDKYMSNQIKSSKIVNLPFSGLSTYIKYKLATLDTQQRANAILTETSQEIISDTYTVYMLESVNKSDENLEKETDINTISEILFEQAQGELLSQWITQLKKKANVTISAALSDNSPDRL